MAGLRKRARSRRVEPPAPPPRVEPDPLQEVGYNAQRDEYLYWLTADGYIIAQDVNCQHEYVQESPCPHCGGTLKIVAHINRAGQGLSEIVALCTTCRQRANFIFDISNEVYQVWWADQLGPLYLRQYEGDPREPATPA
jgi:hypothetical protein